MNVFMTKKRPVNENRLMKARQRFLAAIETVAAGKPIIIPPADESDDPLLRVLIVDDHRASADTMSMLVGAWGHDVRRAYDGTTGLALAAAYQPDVLLLDITLPGISGLELAQQVRRQARLNDCLIIAVTSRTDAQHRLQCHKAGVELFLVKPVDLSNLQTLLTLLSECRLQTQRDTLAHNVIPKSLRRSPKSNSHSPTRFPCHVRQETVAF